MFDSLTKALGTVFDGLRGKSRLTDADVNAALAQIRVALLEADVALPVVKDMLARIHTAAVGQNLIKSVEPAQQVIKIVNDELTAALGGDDAGELNLNVVPPAVILMVGLQGSGKTTTSAKLAKYLKDKKNKRVMMASLDTQRPAAQDQLRILGEQINGATLPIITGQTPLQITARALSAARVEGYDVLILDTAGRLAIDEELMTELAAVKKAAGPVETLLVADAMTGQDAVNTAKTFNDRIGLSGLILTRVDGDARGGAALSMRAITGQSIRFIGVGEKLDAIESFQPDRMAGRILGMGDVVSLVERAVETVNADEAAAMAAKFEKGQFDFNDMLAQLNQMKRMGGMNELVKMLPGLSKMSGQIEKANLDNKILNRQEAMILSMTPGERARPSLLNASRRRRIAAGSGTSVQDLNKLVKQHEQMATMMKRIKKMGMGGMMDMVKGFMGGKDAAMMNAMKGMAPDDLGALNDPAALKQMMAQMPNMPGGGFPGLPGGASSPLSGLLGSLSNKLKK